MQPKTSYPNNISLPPQNERSTYAPRRIEQPALTAKKAQQSYASKDALFQPKITVFQAIRKQFSNKQTARQILETEIHFYQMVYRVIVQFLFVLPIVAYMNTEILVACTFIYTIVSVCLFFHHAMLLVFYLKLCRMNGYSVRNVFRNVYHVISFLFSIVWAILGLFLINRYSGFTGSFATEYMIHILVMSNYYTVANVYFLFTNFTYHRNLRAPNSFAYHINFWFSRNLARFSDICYKTEYQPGPYDENLDFKIEIPVGIRREADGMQYDDE